MCYSQTPLESWPSWTRSAGSRRPPTSPSSKRLSSSLATTRSSRRRSSSRTSANSRSCTTPERWAAVKTVRASANRFDLVRTCLLCASATKYPEDVERAGVNRDTSARGWCSAGWRRAGLQYVNFGLSTQRLKIIQHLPPPHAMSVDPCLFLIRFFCLGWVYRPQVADEEHGSVEWQRHGLAPQFHRDFCGHYLERQ